MLNVQPSIKRLDILYVYKYPDYRIIQITAIPALTLPYPEHLSPTYRADTLGSRLPILHGYCLSVFHFPLGTTFHTICLHWSTSFLWMKHIPSNLVMSIGITGIYQLFCIVDGNLAHGSQKFRFKSHKSLTTYIEINYTYVIYATYQSQLWNQYETGNKQVNHRFM